LSCLKEWDEKHETMSRVRLRIEHVLDWAKVKGYRQGENAARWKGHLSHILTARPARERGHFEAMPWREVPTFATELRKRTEIAAYGLEFILLTCCRCGEALGALRSEIDLDKKLWTIPKERMKGGREHTVPLTDRVVEIIKKLDEIRVAGCEFLFPGQKRASHLSHSGLRVVKRKLGVTDYSIHGWRSSFRDWAAECTQYSGDVIEMSLAHLTGSATELAYKRTNLIELRRALMCEWEAHVTGNKIVKLDSRRPRRA